jgi:hypothetical protein
MAGADGDILETALATGAAALGAVATADATTGAVAVGVCAVEL